MHHRHHRHRPLGRPRRRRGHRGCSPAPPYPRSAAAGGDPWAQLRQCESGGNYSTNTGNGYYGELSVPATVGAQSVYRITGTSRPDSTVTVKIRAGGHAPWTAYPKKTDGKGRFSVAWRARTDYQFQVVGERTSPIRTVRIGTTAAAAPTERLAAGSGGLTVTVAGTGRPRAKVILFVTTATGKWRTWAKLSTDARGRWQADVPAPTKAFRYYAKSRTASGPRSGP